MNKGIAWGAREVGGCVKGSLIPAFLLTSIFTASPDSNGNLHLHETGPKGRTLEGQASTLRPSSWDLTLSLPLSFPSQELKSPHL